MSRKRATYLLGAAAIAATGLATAAASDVGAEPADVGGVCTSVAHVGDSTSVGMMDPAVIPDEAERLAPMYKSTAGVTETFDDSLGGRAIVERVNGGTSGEEAMRELSAKDPACYVIALGTNDAANIAVGSNIDAASRIEKIMAIAGDKPVLWPTVKTAERARAVNGYAPEGMTSFNEALNEAAQKHANLRVVDWASSASDDLFTSDGIHYTAEGTKQRVAAFAAALAASTDTTAAPAADSPAAPTTSAPAPSTPEKFEDAPYYWPSKS